MPSLEFESITIAHFKAFAAPQTLNFADLGPGLFFMRGWNEVEPRLQANGAGKSTIWDALCWCIYGKTANGLRNPELKPWDKNTTPSVSVLLHIDDTPHTITRKAVTNGLVIDGKEVGSEAAAELLNIDFDVFINTILLAQGLPLFFDRAPRDKMQLFSDVLRLSRWEDRSKAASERSRELENLESELVGELNGLEAAAKQAEETQNGLRQNSEEWEEKRRTRAKELETSLKANEDTLKKLSREKDDATLAADSAGTELKQARKDLPGLQKTVSGRWAGVTDSRAEITLLEREKTRFERQLADLSKAKVCPTCSQPLKGVSTEKHEKECTKQIAYLGKQLATENRVLASALEHHTEAVQVMERAGAATKVFEDKEEAARARLDFLNPQVAQLEAQIRAARAGQKERQDERNPFTEQIQALRRRKDQLAVEVAALQADRDKAGEALARSRFWVKGFKEVQLYLLEDVLQELEVVTNVALAELGLEGWEIAYSLEKETKSGTTTRGLTLTVLSPSNSKAVRYESWSGGEGQRLRIVGALALSQVLLGRLGIETNLEVLDEPTRGLSPAGVTDLCLHLKERAQTLKKTIFLIDHTARQGNAFSGTVSVIKTAKGALIETE